MVCTLAQLRSSHWIRQGRNSIDIGELHLTIHGKHEPKLNDRNMVLILDYDPHSGV